MDETPIKAGRAGKGKMKSTWYWPIYGEADEVCFTGSPSRGSVHVHEQLGNFASMLLSDGYAAYDAYARHCPEVIRAQCWAYTRRYFERATENDPAAIEALELIATLYRVEREIREQQLSGPAQLVYRSRHAHPIVEVFFGWCHAQRQRLDLLNSTSLAKWGIAKTTRHSYASIWAIRMSRSTPTPSSAPYG
jgi:hypothetical protein